MHARLSPQRILLGLALSSYYLLVGYKLLVLGKHGDGIEYACVARNMAEGWGTFWKPYLSDTIHPVFHEHPPLIMWIQSLGFRIFGDGAYFEGFYGFTMGLIILCCTARFWRQTRRDYQLEAIGSWWAILLLSGLPLFTYFTQTNRFVVTFTAIAVISTYVAYRGMVAKDHMIPYSLLTGIWIYLGFIAKGPAACFPFAVPFIAWLAFRIKFSKAVVSTLIAVMTFVVILLATFYLFPDSFEFWKGFWKAQVVASLTSERAAGDTHWYLLERWVSEMIVPAMIVGVTMLATGVSFRKLRFNRQAVFFLLVALAGSLPFLISRRQHARYILHSFPFFMLSLAFLADRVAIQLEAVVANRSKIRLIFAAVTIMVFATAITSMFYRKDTIARRRPFYEDFYLQNIQMPERITLSVCPAEMIMGDWLFADMQRFYKVSLTGEMGREYLIIDKNSPCPVPKGYQSVHRGPAVKYLLYKKSRP